MQHFEIMPPAEGAKQIATETRAKLAELALKFSAVEAPTALSKDTLKQWKGYGAALAEKNAQEAPVDAVWRVLVALSDTEFKGGNIQLSYALEGAVNAMRKHLHSAGQGNALSGDPKGVQMLLMAVAAPRHTSREQDIEVRERFGALQHLLYAKEFENVHVRACSVYHRRSADLFEPLAGLCCENLLAGIVVDHFDEFGEPFVAGMLTPHDVMTLRFRRVRLGAYLTEMGLDDADVRRVVNNVKAERAQCYLRMYPNDVLWGEVYAGGVESCMAHKAGHWDDMEELPTQHPVDAYSSAYWGSGDNSLALVVAVDEQGEMLGRGILSVVTGKVVRWYGAVQGDRTLQRAGVSCDEGALEGSWLSFLSASETTSGEDEEPGRFVHPYVDGLFSEGRVQGNWVLLVAGGGQNLQDTAGWSWIGEDSGWCSYNERNYRASAITRQRITGYNVRTASLERARAEWACPITGEWVPADTRERVRLDGEEVLAVDAYYISNAIALGKLTGLRSEYTPCHGYSFYRIEESEEAA